MDESQKKKLDDRIQNIIKKYKDKPHIYPKIKKVAYFIESYPSIKFERYKELAKLTTKINYDCGFMDEKYKKNRNKMCCCSNCLEYVGHLDIKFFNHYDTDEYIEKELLYYAKKFSKNTGFWRKNKGCILPRERRSITCLTYNCSKNLTKEERLVMELLRHYNYPKYTPSYISLLIQILKDHFLYREE